MASLLLTVLVVVLVWLWSSATRGKSQATAYCARACRDINVQFLDQTVVLAKVGVGRHDRNWFQWQRVYEFEFTVDGNTRHRGQLALQGRQVVSTHLDHPEGAIILQPNGSPVR